MRVHSRLILDKLDRFIFLYTDFKKIPLFPFYMQ